MICGETTGDCAVAGRDEIDARILRVLQRDGRISNLKLDDTQLTCSWRS